MGFNMLAALGGAAKRGSEILKEEREEYVDVAIEQLKAWNQVGLPKARQRRELKRANDKLYDDLSAEGFDEKSIAVIMGQKKGQAVLDHIQSMRNNYKDYRVKPAEIVSITPGYDETNLTKDQILENVMGKVNRGMNVRDAIADVTGKRPDRTLTGLLGGDLGQAVEAKYAQYEKGSGISVDEIRALATDDVTYESPLVRGTITLADPAARARAEKALQDSTTGMFTSGSFLKQVMLDAGQAARIKANILDDGSVQYQPAKDRKDEQVRNIVRSTLQQYREANKNKNKFDFTDLEEVNKIINRRLTDKGLMVSTTQAGGGTGTGTGGGATGATPATGGGAGTGGTQPVQTSVYSGMSSNSIVRQAIKDAKSLPGPQQTQIIALAKQAIIADLAKTMTMANARKKADQLEQDILNSL